MFVTKSDSFSDLYQKIIYNLYHNFEYETNPRGLKIREIINFVFQLNNPYSNLFKNSARSLPLKYLAGEIIWYFSGKNDLKFIDNYSKFWKNIANDDGTCNSAYGNLIFTKKDNPEQISQWYWAFNSLIKDKDSRQALIHFNRPDHQSYSVKDFVCTLNGVFHIRNNKLDFTVMMRSNDVFFGLTYDLPFFTLLQQQMYRHLKSHYSNLEMGSYLHHSLSLHLYEKDFEVIKNMLNNDFVENQMPVLDCDLVDEFGNQTKEFLELYNAIMNKKDFKSESKFLNFLYNYGKI